MKLPIPPDLSAAQARVAIGLLERVIDALIELHAEMRRLYHPWGLAQPDDWDQEAPF